MENTISVDLLDREERTASSTAPPSVAEHSDLQRILAVSSTGLLIFAILYSFFLYLHTRFPYIQAGADLVAQSKHNLAQTGRPFAPSGLHVMAFGHSKVLSGFKPSVFDREMAAAGIQSVESYNFGLPGDDRFVSDLDAMAARGVAPDVALLILPWPAAQPEGSTFFAFAKDDQEIMDRLFPFRKLPRDFFILGTEAHGRPHAMRANYLENARTVHQVEIDRGYYFIVRQSHYSHDELPEGLRAPTDTPDTVFPRDIPGGPVFDHLVATLASRHIKCLFVPSYFREGEFASPASINLASVRALAGRANFGVVGPDYFLYPNRLFSDFRHTNPRGAEIYTRAVADLVAQWLKDSARKQ